ncbi:ATP-binding cassette domain-containing protein [Verticiella sediminum]|uniref:ATP-binding cassette domain-containing protein n=1 Tax=Verticiella sediminum TaxID=1247510 RepID=A0A556AKG6_9BURK|nr:oligopeptide/dipeptide ABC transporter ATP-binding protein [Verticiella sediminum]TSH93388.1 ATP-binding cassette domain-containing protein [Verticiella sediminum]
MATPIPFRPPQGGHGSTNPAGAPLLRVRELRKHYPVGGLFGKRGRVAAVDGVSFDIAAGETLGLVGESGCGKSTTGRLILRLIEASSGTVEFRGEDLTRLDRAAMTSRRRDIQLVFQDPYSSLNPSMTVRELIAEPLIVHRVDMLSGVDRRVADLLGMVGLKPEHMHRYPHEFSGGQRQRIGIARALALDPQLLVCDEPVSALDVSVQAQVLNLLRDLQLRTGVGMLFISHDLMAVRYVAHRVAVMYLGKLVETAPTGAMFAAPRHPYTRALLDAVPTLQPENRPRTVLQGDLPSPLNPPEGCHFHPRCAYATARCRQEAPRLSGDGDGHASACHHWRDLPPWPGLSPSLTAPPPPRLARLLERFRQPIVPEVAPLSSTGVR